MANTASRLSANGSLTINGTFDEVTGPLSKNGLIGYWDMSQPYSSNTNYWFDQSGYNNHIQLIGGGSANQTTGNINFFSANTSYGQVTIPQLAGVSTITIECVAKSAFNGGMFFGFGAYDVFNSSGYFGFNTASSDIYGISPAQVTSLGLANNYKHYVFVMTASGSIPTINQIWINGVQQTLTQQIGTTTTGRTFNFYGAYSLVLNGWDTTGSYKLNISYANFKIYNRQLTSKEIIQNYNVYAPTFGFTKIGINPVSTLISNTVSQTITQVISGVYDEVTYNPSSNNNVNLVQWSQDYTQSVWYKAGSSVTGNAAMAPDGTMTANQLIVNNGGTNGWLDTGGYTPAFKANTPYTFSVYAKAGNASPSQFYILLYGTLFSNRSDTNVAARFDLATVTAFNEGGTSIDSVGITPVGNGWYRCWMTATARLNIPANGISTQVIRTVYTTVGQYMLFWGYQIEQATSPSIYVRTGANAIIANTFNQRTVNTGNTYICGSYDEVYTGPLNMVTNGLTLYMDAAKLDSYPGTGTRWNDIGAGANFNATFTATPNHVGGQYIAFDATYYANTGKTPAQLGMYNQPFTAMALFRVPDIALSVPGGTNDHMVLGTATTLTQQGMHFGTRNNNFFMGFYAADVYGTATVVPNTWYLVTWVWNNTAPYYTIYVNGVLNTTGGGNTPFLGTTNLLIGSSAVGTQKSDVNMVAVYNRALSQAEVTQNYNAFRGPFGI